MNLLSTAVGPVLEPLLPRGVVNLWQNKSGTQCVAYGWWIGHFTYQCDAGLLHDITSHPAIKQHHQLAYVSWQAADTEGHTKSISFGKKTAVNTWHFQSSQHQAVCDPITHFTSARDHVLEDSAQIPSWDGVIHDMRTQSIPRGNVEHGKTLQSRREGTNPILRWSGHLTREVILESTCVGKKKLHSEHFMVPGALSFLKVLGALNYPKLPGALNFPKVLGALDFLKVLGALIGLQDMVLDLVRSEKPFIFLATTPLLIGVGAL